MICTYSFLPFIYLFWSNIVQYNSDQLETISSVLKQERESKGLLLREVGAAVNIDTSMVSKYEKGERLPSPKQVISFAQFYEMDKDYLLTLLLSDRIMQDIEDSPYAMQALQLAWEKLQNRKKL